MHFTKELIAPCGMNCGVCLAYLREKDKCSGCLTEGENKAKHCTTCRIKLCNQHDITSFTYCYECPKYPCTRMKKLEERYSKNYMTSLIGNLTFIEAYGIEPFLKKEEERWTCPSCGETLCIHRDYCTQCKTVYR